MQGDQLPVRHRLFRSGFAAIAAIGADRWLRPLTLGSGMILMFHHVRPAHAREFSPNASLEVTPEFLALTLTTLRANGIDIISMDEVAQRLAKTESKRPFAALTFDDGYRDNIQFAAPVLNEFRAPWTLYVVDEFASGRGSLWWLELEGAIASNPEVSVSLDRGLRRFSTRTITQKYAAFAFIQRELKAGSAAQLRRVVGELRAIRPDGDRLVPELCADWQDLRSLAEDPLVTIGSHTLTHPILSRCDARTAESEIAESKDAIEKAMGRAVRHLAFPHGDRGSAGGREFRLSRESGYDTAVTTRPGHIFSSRSLDRWALPRVSINGLHQNKNALRALLSGAIFLPWNLTRLQTRQLKPEPREPSRQT